MQASSPLTRETCTLGECQQRVRRGDRSSCKIESAILPRSFRDIPRADLEITFPDKRVFVSATSYVSWIASFLSLLVAALGVVWGLHKRIWTADGLRIGYVLSPLVALLLRLYSDYSSFQSAVQRTRDAIAILSGIQSRDSQEGVLSGLVERLTEQRSREAVLAYGVLLTRARRALKGGTDDAFVTQAELEKLVLDHLEESFGAHPAHLDLTEALQLLEMLGCAEVDGENHSVLRFRCDAALAAAAGPSASAPRASSSILSSLASICQGDGHPVWIWIAGQGECPPPEPPWKLQIDSLKFPFPLPVQYWAEFFTERSSVGHSRMMANKEMCAKARAGRIPIEQLQSMLLDVAGADAAAAATTEGMSTPEISTGLSSARGRSLAELQRTASGRSKVGGIFRNILGVSRLSKSHKAH